MNKHSNKILKNILASLMALFFGLCSLKEEPSSNPKLELNIRDITKHCIELYIEGICSLDSVSITIKDDCRIYGKYTKEYHKKTSADTINVTFRFIPANYYVEAKAYFAGDSLVKRTQKETNQLLKSVIIDRDAEVQKMYLFYGDFFNLFGFLIDSTKISTGKPGHPTPLGYYSIHKKCRKVRSLKYKRWMEWANFYYGNLYIIHQGYSRTPYGKSASHGCVRLPKEFAKKFYEWADLGTKVIVIGSENKSNQDSMKFDINNYEIFKSIIKDVSKYSRKIKAGNFLDSYYVGKVSNYKRKILEYSQLNF